MIKIKKDNNIKKEYIPVIIGVIILVLFSILLVLTINYDGNIKKEELDNKVISDNEDLSIGTVNSKCDAKRFKELNKLAKKVGAEYYVDEKKVKVEPTEEDELFYETLEDGYYTEKIIAISIYGITDDIYVIVTNDYNDSSITIKKSDLNKDGKYIFEAVDIGVRVTYTVSIYSNDANCSKELLRKTTFKTKIFNNFSHSMACVVYPNYENCAELVDKEIDANTFQIGYRKYQKEHDPNEEKSHIAVIKAMAAYEGADEKELKELEKKLTNKKENIILTKLKQNKELIIISITIIAIGILVIVLLMFMRRNKK